MTEPLRHCNHCGEDKPNADFGSKPQFCRACVNKFQRERNAMVKRMWEARTSSESVKKPAKTTKTTKET